MGDRASRRVTVVTTFDCLYGAGDDLDAFQQIWSELRIELGVIGHHNIKGPPAIIRPLGAVHERSSLQGNAISVVLNVWVGHNLPYRHRQIQFNEIPSVPRAVESDVTVLHDQWHRFSIKTNGRRSGCVTNELIEISWHDCLASPSRNP